ncbi:7-cyano-7-deazaguanine synthase [uncultured Fusobacterium sp.]|uniref:7-cyano-7-deazaguanine synthase n=1 Tax=uncultured Fusobacterium sp. TaxID=159267 RepID=UPI0025CEBE36|nr:7-cyano-7-deazaguanine synthase [uncultured Fusobacterium sp.]
MEKKIKALALFSGGLDSALAVKVVKDQGVEVIGLNFVSHFFGGKNEKAESMAKQLGIQLEYIDFKKRHTDMMQNPVYGRGKNMNPCIDCHSLMFKIAGELLEKYDAQFIISGEVLGQRPMSQNSAALEKVKALSGMDDLILRPLSAKLLPPSRAEIEGWVDREQLLDIQGRSRAVQMELTEKYGLVEYPTPGGGCLLTDPAYSDRLEMIEKDGLMNEEHSYLFHLIKKTRFYRLGERKYLFIGRDEEGNSRIEEYKEKGTLHVAGYKIGGPRILGYGDFSDEDKKFVVELFSRYSKVKGKSEIEVRLNNQVVKVAPVDIEEIERKIKEYQVVAQ